MKKQKKALTLLEVMIALALTGTLLFVLFNIHRQLFVSHTLLSKNKQLIVSREVLHLRLLQVFSHIKKEPLFYSDDEGFLFSFDNGIDPDPNFCDQLIAKLSFSKKELGLVLWGKDESGRKEVLLEGVSSLQFSFFDAKDQKWVSEWPKKKKRLPAIAKLNIDGTEWAFFLPQEEAIIYEGGSS